MIFLGISGAMAPARIRSLNLVILPYKISYFRYSAFVYIQRKIRGSGDMQSLTSA